MPEVLTRHDKAVAMWRAGIRPISRGRDRWLVDGAQLYEIERKADGEYFCTCPDSMYRHATQSGICKHCELVLLAEKFDSVASSDEA